MNRKSGLSIVAMLVVAGTSLMAVAASAVAAPARPPGARQVGQVPRIVARPASVMVNTRTELSGTGFRPGARLTIWECSSRTWIVPMQVCNHRNAVHVRTSEAGQFKVALTALVCPAGIQPASAGFARTCYVGVPTVRGIDVVTLAGAAKITVTGP